MSPTAETIVEVGPALPERFDHERLKRDWTRWDKQRRRAQSGIATARITRCVAGAALLLCAASAPAADAMHVPLLCSHWPASHAAAGAIVGVCADRLLRYVPHLHEGARAALSIGIAGGVGWLKEHALDRHAHDKQIGPWLFGASAALTISYEVRW